MSRPDRSVLTVSRLSPDSLTHATSSLRKQTMLVRVADRLRYFLGPRPFLGVSNAGECIAFFSVVGLSHRSLMTQSRSMLIYTVITGY